MIRFRARRGALPHEIAEHFGTTRNAVSVILASGDVNHHVRPGR